MDESDFQGSKNPYFLAYNFSEFRGDNQNLAHPKEKHEITTKRMEQAIQNQKQSVRDRY